MPSPLVTSGLAELKAEQDRKFQELTPNAKTCFASIRDLDRYEKLTDTSPDGLIVSVKADIARAIEKLSIAVNQGGTADQALAASRDSMTINETTGVPKIVLSIPIQRGLHSALRDVSYLAKNLVQLLRNLEELEKEVAYLEPRILDDGNLPDFDALKDTNKGDESSDFDRATAELANSLKPVKWNVSYTVSDTVVAPSEEGAKNMMAMRIKRNVALESMTACRQDEPSDVQTHAGRGDDGTDTKRSSEHQIV